MKKVKKVSVLSAIVFVCSVFWLMPLLLIFINSFKPYNDMLQRFLSLPKSWSLTMYLETWTKFRFPLLISNTLLYTACTVLVITLLAPMAAYQLARTKGRLSAVCFILIIMPMMVPFQSYMITLTRLVASVGMTGHKSGYILVNTGLCMPLAVYMIHGFVKNVPIELEECACIDGASKVRTYFAIVLPLLKPILTTVVVLDTLAIWNDIITNQLIVGGNAKAMNIQNALYMQFSAQTADWEHALPGIVMSMVPSLVFFVIMQKHIVGGITAGAVKG
ncbi:carbohydrate ABC transporter permease [Lacrimispora saccharolytica]|uniref:Binding-protein-dependent transport systems inner membrane component n=1 Tax=Lacrimispora saccharolytica (strain ATCC 35040 / DSM 2544 / NRCC 2533 / WM1) TaxID=610130 RepID=D9R2Y4_LACSW|nr:carbohydrate ABC transporter permease [Lacrimispora saccharolytica]ADL02974.1 binding-protein-dependent transport systems inner membrane component [[Clostridium] saccharolyticum WM1]QRV18836.1 carbohydrate ABC transporter permease [Lacrimispora saccharolytica]